MRVENTVIRSSKSHLPALWADREELRLEFFLTKPSYEARPVVFKYPTERRSRSHVNRFITVTLHISDPEQPLTLVE